MCAMRSHGAIPYVHEMGWVKGEVREWSNALCDRATMQRPSIHYA